MGESKTKPTVTLSESETATLLKALRQFIERTDNEAEKFAAQKCLMLFSPISISVHGQKVERQ